MDSVSGTAMACQVKENDKLEPVKLLRLQRKSSGMNMWNVFLQAYMDKGFLSHT